MRETKRAKREGGEEKEGERDRKVHVGDRERRRNRGGEGGRERGRERGRE